MNKFKAVVAIVMLTMIVSAITVQVMNATPAGKNAGWFHSEFTTFRPRIFTKAVGAVSANASIYVPGIKTTDYLWCVLECDSVGSASTDFNDLTDSTYIQDTDSIRCGTATTAGSDLIIMVHRSNY